jgi:hypothetical protein
MKRIKILFGQRRFQVLATLTGVIMAVAVVMASGASFTAHTANADNVFSAGKLAMENTPNGMSVTVTNMVPGDSHDGTVTIANTGDVQGNFYLEPVTISGDTMDGKFANELQVVINDGKADIYKGSLSGLKQVDLGVWQPKDQKTFSFHVSFPDNGRTASTKAGEGAIGNDNQYMGASTTAQFDWTAVSVPVGEIAGK